MATVALLRLRAGKIPGLVVTALFPLHGGSFFPLFPLGDMIWLPMVFLSMSKNNPLSGHGHMGRASQGRGHRLD